MIKEVEEECGKGKGEDVRRSFEKGRGAEEEECGKGQRRGSEEKL